MGDLKRRTFFKYGLIGAFFGLVKPAKAAELLDVKKYVKVKKPVVISTWIHGLEANKGAWEVLGGGGKALKAVEKGVRVTESDMTNRSVGLGGRPDRDGNVTLDACIMDEKSRCGAVAYLENIKHPISVARTIMEETPHVMLAGDGAQQFALDYGFNKTKAPL